MIYLAAPYNDFDKSIICDRMDKIYAVIAFLTNNGNHVVTPLLMHEIVVRYEIDGSFNFWEKYCIDLLSRCDKLYVLMIDDWDTRHGIKKEIEYAIDNNIEVVYINHEDFS
ncbi:MAG: DUF1937 family protein [Bacteroidales bacterium]|jgi:hypothetical protein